MDNPVPSTTPHKSPRPPLTSSSSRAESPRSGSPRNSSPRKPRTISDGDSEGSESDTTAASPRALLDPFYTQ
jgi:hypothetical protein